MTFSGGSREQKRPAGTRTLLRVFRRPLFPRGASPCAVPFASPSVPCFRNLHILYGFIPQERVRLHVAVRQVPELHLDLEFMGEDLPDRFLSLFHVLGREQDIESFMDRFPRRKTRVLDDAALLIWAAPHPVAPPQLLRDRHVD